MTINLTPSSSLPALSTGNISLNRTGTVIGDINAAVSLLESFGTTKVLSSPKLSVINNQTAIIKVIDNYVYVTIAYTPPVLSASGNNVVSPGAYVSTINTVPIGFVMTVTPQIADSDQVTLNVHPSITRVIGTINDPAPALANNTQVTNLIPVVQSREMESILRVQSGEIAVLGGLMQESSTNNDQGIPGVARNTFGGALTGARSEVRAKTELVIFMRPIVIKDASVNGDYKEFKPQLPTSSFFNEGSANTWGVKK
jgi:general secretion pathway protein D